MIASRADGSTEQRGRGVFLGVAFPGALFPAALCFALACSEGQYNPPLSTAGAGGMTGSAGAGGGSAGSGTSGSGVGGSSGSGSAGSAGAGNSGPGQLYAFTSGLEGFSVNYFCTGPAVGVNCAQVTAQPAEVVDAGVDAGDAAPPVTPPAGNDFYELVQDGSVGDPDPGSAKLTLQLSTGTQSANVAINYGSGTVAGVNLTGKTIRAQVRVEAGAAPITAKMYIKTSGTYYYADGGQVNLIADTWVSATMNPGIPSYPTAPDAAQYLINDVREIGLEISAVAATAVPAVVHIDTLQY
jgi:hypothetical protein